MRWYLNHGIAVIGGENDLTLVIHYMNDLYFFGTFYFKFGSTRIGIYAQGCVVFHSVNAGTVG